MDNLTPTPGAQKPVTGESELLKRFTYHPPKGTQADRYQLIRDRALSFALIIDNECPSSREKSLAMTKLEEAVMWANASIARNE